MTQLNQVRGALAQRLREEGMAALTAYSQKVFYSLDEVTAVIGVRRGEIRSAGFLDYLGRAWDEAQGTEVEVYGREVSMSLSLDLYAPASAGAEGCEEGMEKAAEALMSGLPSGLRMEEMKREETQWDETYGLFLLRGSIDCRAFFTAKADEDTTVLTDFILKGVVEK